MDGDVTLYQFMVRQYIARNIALHLQYMNNQIDWDYDWNYTTVDASAKSTQNLVLFGGQAVINDLIGITVEFGEGDEKVEYSGSLASWPTANYNVSQVNMELALFAGKRLSFFLGVDTNDSEQTGMLPGYKNEWTGQEVSLGTKYWFNEKASVGMKIYQSTNENTFATPFTSTTDTSEYDGFEINAGFMF